MKNGKLESLIRVFGDKKYPRNVKDTTTTVVLIVKYFIGIVIEKAITKLYKTPIAIPKGKAKSNIKTPITEVNKPIIPSLT